MGRLMLNAEFGLYQRDADAFCDSLQVAETFGRRHDGVLRDTRSVMRDAGAAFGLRNFVESSYRNSQNKRQPKYYMTKDGFTLLVMGYTGKKAMAFKIAYINRFNQMERHLKELSEIRASFPAFTDAIQMAHEEPKSHHYRNECDMLNRIVLGMSSAEYRKQRGIPAGQSIRPYLSDMEAAAIHRLQIYDVGLLATIMEYSIRKRILTDIFKNSYRLLA